jgi:hypothetical protein
MLSGVIAKPGPEFGFACELSVLLGSTAETQTPWPLQTVTARVLMSIFPEKQCFTSLVQ